MEQHRLRRVPVATKGPRRDVWFRVTGDSESIHLDTLFGRRSFSVAFWRAQLARWGGFAGIVGGVLWIIYSLLAGLEILMMDFNWYHLDPLGITLFLDSQLLAFPSLFLLLLLLIGVAGLHALQLGQTGKLVAIGLFLAAAGLIVHILAILGVHVPTLFDLRSDDNFSELFGILNVDWPAIPRPLDWYKSLQPGLLILAIGLVLVTAANLRSKVLPSGPMILLVTTLLLAQLIEPVADWIAPVVDPYYFRILSYQAYAATLLAVFFGIGWVWIGREILSRSSREWKSTGQ
jgi:hypothetical protein